MIDSGGGLGLRNLSFAIMLLFAAYGALTFYSVNRKFLFIYVLFLVSLIPGIFTSFINPQVPAGGILFWIFSFLLIPFFLLYVKASKLNGRTYVFSGTIFGILIITLFFGRLYGIAPINNINEYITSHSDGFFGNKNFVSGDILPNVYFQGTLSLIICVVMSLENKNYFSYLIILIALVLAPSRFGFMVTILWGLIIYIRKSYLRIFLIPLLGCVLVLILYNLPFGTELFAIFNGQSDGVDIRNGHIQSIIHEFDVHPLSFLTGEGPGSLFYSQGYGDYVDNIELSQFEYLRKYGIFSFLVFTLFYFGPLLKKQENTFFLKGALVMYYIVSFSNPVLYSMFAMLFLTLVYVETFQINSKKIYNTIG